ncbi:MAG: hypothetical protein WD276_01695 [Actinomycetota bacterium]
MYTGYGRKEREVEMNPLMYWGLIKIRQAEIRRDVEAIRRTREASSWRRERKAGSR